MFFPLAAHPWNFNISDIVYIHTIWISKNFSSASDKNFTIYSFLTIIKTKNFSSAPEKNFTIYNFLPAKRQYHPWECMC